MSCRVKRALGWLAALAAFGGLFALRRLWNWGAIPGERLRALPGDDLIPAPRLSTTRAIRIAAPPAAIWPWLVQIGWRRAGWYSYDTLERLAGAADFVDGARSARRIVPELQALAVGDLIRLGPEPMPAFAVAQIEPERALVLHGAEGADGAGASWAFVLEPHGADATRLIARFRLTYPPTCANRLLWGASEAAHLIMERKMLRGIRQRAQASLWRWQRES